ncbi:MAG: PQQ-like beta-propeller repeat protein [Gemmataceae bacterium]|nr:PQQ-like beta-propeller repeat protein [Gemmataceae bacterium]
MRKLLTALTTLVAVSAAPAGDWPQWLGPRRDGSTDEVVRPWKEPLKVIWRVKVGEGHSTPVVVGDQVILHAAGGPGVDDEPAVKAKLEYVTAFAAKDGAVRWVGRMDKKPFQSQFGNGPRATPAVAGGQVFALGVTGTLAAFDLNNGKLTADQVDLIDETKARVPYFGVSTSPLVVGDNVWVMAGGTEAGLTARNVKTLKPVSKSLADAASYSAPILTSAGGKEQIVALTADAVYGIPTAGGDPFWKFRFTDLLSESSATPIRSGDLLIASSVTLGSVALRLGEKDGKPTATEAWRNSALSCYFSTPVSVGKEIYLVTGQLIPPPIATLYCVDAETGKVLWKKPGVGKYGATLVKTGDGKLLMLEESGDLVLIEPGRDKYVELARSKVCGETWAHFAVSGSRAFLRDRQELICVELPGPSSIATP